MAGTNNGFAKCLHTYEWVIQLWFYIKANMSTCMYSYHMYGYSAVSSNV